MSSINYLVSSLLYERMIPALHHIIPVTNGECILFALALNKKLNNKGKYIRLTDSRGYGHVFVQYNNKYWDHRGIITKEFLNKIYPNAKFTVRTEAQLITAVKKEKSGYDLEKINKYYNQIPDSFFQQTTMKPTVMVMGANITESSKFRYAGPLAVGGSIDVSITKKRKNSKKRKSK